MKDFRHHDWEQNAQVLVWQVCLLPLIIVSICLSWCFSYVDKCYWTAFYVMLMCLISLLLLVPPAFQYRKICINGMGITISERDREVAEKNEDGFLSVALNREIQKIEGEMTKKMDGLFWYVLFSLIFATISISVVLVKTFSRGL